MRNRVALFALLSICVIPSLMLEAQTPATKETEELARLKNTFEQKRADALKPVNAWYETQLENARKKLTQKGDLEGALQVQNELKTFRESSLRESTDEFKKALLSTTWSWSEIPNDRGVEMTFKDEPTVSHIGMRGTWKITGPREVTLIEGGVTHVFRFDQKITEYQKVGGTGKPIFGRRWQ